MKTLLPWTSVLVWPLMLTLPLLMTSSYSPISYAKVFSKTWYEYEYDENGVNKPKPLGLILGLLAVAVGQVFVWLIFYIYKFGHILPKYDNEDDGQSDNRKRREPNSIQVKGARKYDFMEGLITHISQPEGFILLGSYLAGTWMYNLMPISYYNFEGTIQYDKVILCLFIQDILQYISHRLEHDLSPTIYKMCHKSHHKFINPRLFDAFNGSTTDTIVMILIPLYITANIVHDCNVWTYMAFGSTYANWLTLIHSEYYFPWDNTLFYYLGFGTPADHHVHHAFFKYNFGHLFMYMDMLFGTYKNPNEFIPKQFNSNK